MLDQGIKAKTSEVANTDKVWKYDIKTFLHIASQHK